MAVTITGTQVQFPSSGNMEGLYTGASNTNTSFPIGSYVFVFNIPSTPTRNATISGVGYSIYSTASYVTNETDRVLLSGTWVNRGTIFIGCFCTTTRNSIIQRIA